MVPHAPTATRAPEPIIFDDLDDHDPKPFEEFRHQSWWVKNRPPLQLWRYMTAEIVRVMLVGIVTISLFYSAIAAYQTVKGGIQLTYIWPFLAKTIFYPLYFSIPLSLLFGVTLTLGRMVGDLEIAAMRYHGTSHAQIFAPILILAFGSAILTQHVNAKVVPDIRYDKRNLQQYVIKQLENLGSGQNRTIPLPDEGGSLLVGAYKGTDLWKVEVDLNRKLQSKFVPEIRGQLPQKLPERITLLAKMGRLQIAPDRQGVIIHLRGVEVLIPEKANQSGERFYQRFSITETLSIPLSFDHRSRKLKDLRSPQLSDRIQEIRESLEEGESEASRQALFHARAEWHRRLAFTMSAFTFPLIGIGICFLLDRRTRLVPFFTSNLVVLAVFFPLLMIGSSLAERGFWPWLALLLPNLALVGIGVVLMKKVVRQ